MRKFIYGLQRTNAFNHLSALLLQYHLSWGLSSSKFFKGAGKYN